MARRVASVFRPGLLNKKCAIVTGGGTGIGLAITQELLHLGCNVMIASRKVERLVDACQKINELKTSSAQLDYMQCNIRDETQVKDLVSETIKKFGKLDYLVNNGGGQFLSPASDVSSKGWHAVVETNLYGTFYMCKQAYHQWMKDHGGSVVNIIADMSKGMVGMCPSGAARAGVENMTKTLAVEWAPAGIRLNCIAPGSSFPSQTAVDNYGLPDLFKKQIPRIPAQRLGDASEISSAVTFLLCPASSFISGITLQIDGAQSLYSTHLDWPIQDHNNYPRFTWEEEAKDQDIDNDCPS